MTRRVLVINPVAGSRVEPIEIVRKVREVAGAETEIRVTSAAGDARRFGEEAASRGVEEIWVAGGDGTLHEVVLGLRDAPADTRPLLVPLPLGTGNDLVRSLGVPLDWSEASDALAGSTRVRELDLMAVELDGESRLALNAVIVGNGGRVGEVLDQEGKARWGPLSYLRSAAEIALELEPREVTLRVDDGPPESRRILNVVVANGRYAGHGIPIAPGARPDDGALEVVTVTEAGLPDLLRMLPALVDEREPEDPAWDQRSAAAVFVGTTGSGPLPVSVDGENLTAREVSVTLADDRIRVRIPTRHTGADDER